MSLQVWLPLRGNLDNYGLSPLKFSVVNSSNTVVNANGKIGSCYSNNSNTAGGLVSDSTIDLGGEISMFCWVKMNSFYSSSSLTGILGQHRYSANKGMGITMKYLSASTGNLSLNTGTGSARTYNTYCGSTTLNAGTWYHVGFTYSLSSSKITLYVNGHADANITYANQMNVADYIQIFGWSLSGSSGNAIHENYKLNGLINDVRIYDHCLSPKEVHDIAQGLVLHYKLDEKTICSNTVNLVANGWGGTENWQNSNVFTNELPTGLSPAPTHSYKNNYTKQFIPINPSHSYTMSSYVKSYDNNPSYLALVPYDIDKLQINNYNTASGFKAASLTTLKQPLRPGDTVIYLADSTDMSNWTSTRYQNMVALFGYRDSTGHIYPDLYYTRRTYSYRSSASNVDTTTNIDFTNKTVTLLNPYSGKETIPAGTSICLTTQGSTYFYPASVSAANSTDWTLLSNTFTPSAKPYLNGVRYVKVCAMSQNYSTAISLVDNSVANIVYDTSGYGNDGTITGTLSFADDTPRYFCSTLFGNSKNITPSLNLSFLAETTVSMWMKLDQLPPSSPGRTMLYTAWYGFSCEITSAGKTYFRTYLNNAICDSPQGTITAGKWYHWVGVKSSTGVSLYLDGTLVGQTSNTNSFSWSSTCGTIGSYGNNYFTYGKISDVRLYSTALSDDDILDLYNSSGNVDDNGTMGFYECNEESHNMLFDQNIGILTKTWVAGLSKATQVNCQCTLTDDGYRIYRPANQIAATNGGTNNMWGGFVIDNTDNRFNLQDNHTYLLQFEIKGQSSNALGQIYWTNYVGWNGGGLTPNPGSQLKLNPVVANFESSEWKTFTYKWTISDGLYKTCTTAYSTYVVGNVYLSYKGLLIGFTYADTETLGTDLYIKNIRMFDITNDVEIELGKEGIMKTKYSVEEPTFREMDLGGLKFEQLIEY